MHINGKKQKSNWFIKIDGINSKIIPFSLMRKIILDLKWIIIILYAPFFILNYLL